MIEVSNGFVMRNPSKVKKIIKRKKDDAGFPLEEISGYNERYAVEFMVEKLNDLPKGSRVFFIGRYLMKNGML